MSTVEVDTLEVTLDVLRSWRTPDFLRAVRVTARILDVAEEIARDGGKIPGVLTIGVLDGVRYLIDGEHHREAFYRSGCSVGHAMIRILHFKTMAEMATEYAYIGAPFAALRTNDRLLAMSRLDTPVTRIRERCPCVGFDFIRRGSDPAFLRMSTVLCCWSNSGKDVPQSGGVSAVAVAEALRADEVDDLVEFLGLAEKAWGSDVDHAPLWKAVNLILCMWLHRRAAIPKETFSRCLRALAADASYVDYLRNRARDCPTTYDKITAIFAEHLEAETGGKLTLPRPAWSPKDVNLPRERQPQDP